MNLLPPLTERDQEKLKLFRNYSRVFLIISSMQFLIYWIYEMSFQNLISLLKVFLLFPLFVAYFYSRQYFKTLSERARKFKLEKRFKILGFFGLSIFPFSYVFSNSSNESSNTVLSWIIAFLTIITMIFFQKFYTKLNK